MTTHAAFHVGSAPLYWHRGPARLEEDEIVLDTERAEEYVAGSDELAALPFDLANLRRPTDVLGFVRRYGLLWTPPRSQSFERAFRPLADLRGDLVHDDAPPRRAAEPIADYMDAADDLAWILSLYRLLGQAQQGDPAALRELRRTMTERLRGMALDIARLSGESVDAVPTFESDSDFLTAVASFVGDLIDEGLAAHGDDDRRVRLGVGLAEPNIDPSHFVFALAPRDLLGAAYAQLAANLVSRVPMATCPECGRVFPVRHGRQRYCDDRCASRARYRRFADRKRRNPEEQDA